MSLREGFRTNKKAVVAFFVLAMLVCWSGCASRDKCTIAVSPRGQMWVGRDGNSLVYEINRPTKVQAMWAGTVTERTEQSVTVTTEEKAENRIWWYRYFGLTPSPQISLGQTVDACQVLGTIEPGGLHTPPFARLTVKVTNRVQGQPLGEVSPSAQIPERYSSPGHKAYQVCAVCHENQWVEIRDNQDKSKLAKSKNKATLENVMNLLRPGGRHHPVFDKQSLSDSQLKAAVEFLLNKDATR